MNDSLSCTLYLAVLPVRYFISLMSQLSIPFCFLEEFV